MSVEGLAFQLQNNFEVIVCYSCKCMFAVPAQVRSKLVESGNSFWCPNGHSQHYTESDVQKLRKQLEAEQRRREWHEKNASAEREAREHNRASVASAERREDSPAESH